MYTDHNPLKYLHVTACAPSNSKLTRWALALQQFDIQVKHRSGLSNKNCDALSRLF